MAEKIVQPKVKKADGTYDELIINKANTAVYASSDTSKGTIEERLTKLGFRQGSINLSSIVTATENKVTRQGNYVIGNLNISELNISNISIFQNNYNIQSYLLGVLDLQFRPKTKISVPFSTPISVDMNYDNYGQAFVHTMVAIHPGGNVELQVVTYGTRNMSNAVNIKPNTIHTNMPVILNFGYQANPIS